jgi:hypothetical protein
MAFMNKLEAKYKILSTETPQSAALAKIIGVTITKILTTTATQNATQHRTARRIERHSLAVDLNHSIAPPRTRAKQVTTKLTLTGTKAATKKKQTKLTALHVRTSYQNMKHHSHIN